MLSIEIKKEIFIRRFIKLHKYSTIASELNLHRNTVSRICNNQLKKIKEFGLCYTNANLYEYVDKIVSNTQSRTKKINPATKMLIKSLYIDNKKNATIKSDKYKNLTSLYKEVFKQVKANPNSKNKNYITDISFSSFYKIIKEIDLELSND